MSYRFLSQLLVFCLLLFSTACSDQTQQSRDHIPQEISNKSFDLANAPLVSVQDTDTLSIILARQNAIEIQLKKNENWEEWQNGLWTGLFCLVLLGLCFSLLKLW